MNDTIKTTSFKIITYRRRRGIRLASGVPLVPYRRGPDGFGGFYDFFLSIGGDVFFFTQSCQNKAELPSPPQKPNLSVVIMRPYYIDLSPKTKAELSKEN